MFRRFFQSDNASQPSAAPASVSSDSVVLAEVKTPAASLVTPGDDGVVRVDVWSMGGTNGVGHAGTQIGGSKPKLHLTDAGHYGSIWPGAFPAIGPFAFLPLKSVIARTILQDARAQGSKKPLDEAFVVSTSQKPARVMPDQSYEIRGLNVKAMERELKDIERDSKDGYARYQLFPAVNLFGFLNHVTPALAAHMAEDPFSGRPNYEFAQALAPLPKRKFRVFNCTSLTEHLLNVGGMEVHKHHRFFRAPWDITPDGLARALERDKRVKKVTPPEDDRVHHHAPGKRR